MVTAPVVAQLPHRIVVGVSNTGTSDDAVRWAIEYAVTIDAEIEAMHAYTLPPMPTYSARMSADIYQIRHQVAATERDKLARRIRSLLDGVDVPIRFCVAEGHPVFVLARAAKTADALVVGAPHKGLIGRRLTSSVGEALASQMPCPLILVPAQPQHRAPAPRKSSRRRRGRSLRSLLREAKSALAAAAQGRGSQQRYRVRPSRSKSAA